MRKLLTLLIALASIAFGVWSPASAQLAGGLMFPGPGTPASAGGGWCSLIPQSGLVNCWPFDTANTTTSVATDVKGGNSFTLTSVTLNGSGPSTNLNNAGVFNGTSSHGNVISAFKQLPQPNSSLVIWVNPTSMGGKRVLATDNPSGGSNNGFQIYGNNSVAISAELGNGTTMAVANPGIVPTSSWTMLSYTYNGTTITPYLNSTAGTPVTLAGPATNGSTNLGVGYNPSYSGDFFPGMIAGIAIYNRVLSSSEVTAINGL